MWLPLYCKCTLPIIHFFTSILLEQIVFLFPSLFSRLVSRFLHKKSFSQGMCIHVRLSKVVDSGSDRTERLLCIL